MPSRKTIPPNLLNEPQSKNVDSTKPDIQMLDVPDLCPHLRQAELVGDMPAAEFEALVAHIAANGIQNPLTVMADAKMIVCGHQRLRAARQLGIKKIACIVRADFVEADDPKVIEALLADNLRRRQLGPIEKARYTKALFEIELGHRLEPGYSSDWHNKTARLLGAKRCALSGGPGHAARRAAGIRRGHAHFGFHGQRGVFHARRSREAGRLDPQVARSLERQSSEDNEEGDPGRRQNRTQ
jgi:hypothetical protein